MGGLVDRWLSTVLAVAGTVVVVLVFLALFGQDAEGPGTAVTSERSAGSLPSATGSVPSPTPSPSGSSGTGSLPPSGLGTTAPSRLRAPVIVLNQAGVKGLAGRTSHLLEAGGWTVAAIGDFSGQVPSNTVYYPPRLDAEARALLRQFPKVTHRMREVFTSLSGNRLTLILATDWR